MPVDLAQESFLKVKQVKRRRFEHPRITHVANGGEGGLPVHGECKDGCQCESSQRANDSSSYGT